MGDLNSSREHKQPRMWQTVQANRTWHIRKMWCVSLCCSSCRWGFEMLQLKRLAQLVVIALVESSGMVSTWQGAKSSMLAKKSAELQTELPKNHMVIRVSGCRECLNISLDCSRDSSCVRCDLLSLGAVMG